MVRGLVKRFASESGLMIRLRDGCEASLEELWGERRLEDTKYKVPGYDHAKFHSTCSSGCSGASLARPSNSAHVSGPGCRIRDVGFDSGGL